MKQFILFEVNRKEFDFFKLIICLPILELNKNDSYTFMNYNRTRLSFPTEITLEREPNISYQFTLTILGLGFRIIRQWSY